MKQLLFYVFIMITYHQSTAQGCVTIRNNGAVCINTGYHFNSDKQMAADDWTIGINNRYFKSYKHFVGTEEQKERVERGTEVINHSFSSEFSIFRQFNQRWSAGLYLPFIHNTRSSMYEHYGNSSTSHNARRSTKSFGFCVIRVGAF